MTVTSDVIGNTLSDGKRTYTWEHGRQLATVAYNGSTWTNTYDADGMRTKRTNGSTAYSYVYNGSQLTQMTLGSNTLTFAYDAAGTPLAVTYNGTAYYYITNLQGDVTGIANSSGTRVVAYTYDAWGNILTTTGSMASTLGAHNPLRYRGYVYDTETELYYLQSRYYDPEMGRFVNADAYIFTGQGLLGSNMFAYCNNNSTNLEDFGGFLPIPAGIGSPNISRFEANTTDGSCSREKEKKSTLYEILTDIATPDGYGRTFSAGVSTGVTYMQESKGISACVSGDDDGNYALQGTTSHGVATGMGISAGITLTYTNASSIGDLEGVSTAIGGTIAAPIGITVDYISFVPASDPNRTCWGICVTISGGAAWEAHKNYNYTTPISKTWNVWRALRDLLCE